MELYRFFVNSAEQQFAVRSTILENTAILLGPSRSGKTSLAFQYAYSLANENRMALFICSKRKIQLTLPLSPQGIVPDQTVLKRIQLKYIEDYESLIQYLSSIHQLPKIPELIVIDDLSHYLAPYFPLYDIVKVMAFFRDSVDFFSNKMSMLSQTDPYYQNRKCQLLITDTTSSELASKHLSVCERWFPLILKIEPHENHSFLFSPFRFHKKTVKSPFVVHFSVGVEAIEVHGYSDMSQPMHVEQQQFDVNKENYQYEGVYQH